MKQEFELIIHYDRIGESDMFNCHGVGELVRCKDCKWYTQFRNIKGELFPEGECEGWGFTKPDDFCSRGERKEVEE